MNVIAGNAGYKEYRRGLLISLVAVLVLVGGAISPAPTQAKTVYGDFYVGFKLSPEFFQQMPTQLPALPTNIPFRGKLYYQDGVYRLDIVLPSVSAQATPTAAKGRKAGPAFQSYTFLFKPEAGMFNPVFIDHRIRRAYILNLPPEMAPSFSPRDFEKAFNSAEFRKIMREQGVIVGKLRRAKPRKYEGLSAVGYEYKLAFKLPETVKALIPEGISTDVTARFLMEKDTKVPLSFELESGVFSLNFGIRNVGVDRVPDVMFRVPELYVVETVGAEDLKLVLEDFGRYLEAVFTGIESGQMPTWKTEAEIPEEPAKAEEVTPEKEEETAGDAENKAGEETEGETEGEAEEGKVQPGVTET